MEYPLVTADINLNAVRSNIAALKKFIPADCRFMAVVKANAYGHGAVETARTAVQSGAHWLGVARLDEATPLRAAGITEPLLVFGYIHPLQAKDAQRLNAAVTVYNEQMAAALSDETSQSEKPLDIHLKVDTGMGRVGMILGSDKKKLVKKITSIARLPGLSLKGIYTHFAAADAPDTAYTMRQLEIFNDLLNDLEKAGIDIQLRHAANSAGIIRFPDAHFDMVRAGISLYGLYPSGEAVFQKADLTAAMTLKTRITAVRKVPKNFCVSYGMTHVTEKPTCLASVPVGYADGYSRLFSSKGMMLVRGKRAPVVGRVCMDQTMIDVGHIENVAAGDEVVVMGHQGNEFIGADELAQTINTINYEIVSSLTPRVRRVYSGSVSPSPSG